MGHGATASTVPRVSRQAQPIQPSTMKARPIVFATIALAAAMHTGASFDPTPAQQHRLLKITRHLPRCAGQQDTGCRVIGSKVTLASFPSDADGGVYFVRIKHRPGHRHVTHAEFYPFSA